MAGILEIVVENARTFYNFRTGKSRGLWLRYATIVTVASALSWAFYLRSDNLYMSLIAAQSILVGFSFNVMIFLASNPNIKIAANASLERKRKIDKLNKLSRELFYNLSYYNVIAILSVITSLIFLLVPMGGDLSPLISRALVSLGAEEGVAIHTSGWIFYSSRWLLLFFLYFSVVDSIASFFRIIQRASYYFESKMALAD